MGDTDWPRPFDEREWPEDVDTEHPGDTHGVAVRLVCDYCGYSQDGAMVGGTEYVNETCDECGARMRVTSVEPAE